MPDHMVIIVLAVGGLVAFLLYKGTMSAREAREERRRGLRALGFEPLASPPPQVAELILALHQHGKKREHKIEEMFERTGAADRLYLLDLKDQSIDGVRHGVIAVLSPRLQVPRITIFPRLEGEGRLAALANMLVKRLGQRHGGTLDFASHPRFARRHFVSGPDEASIRRFLTERRLDRLAQMSHMAVEADGDLFTYEEVRFGRRRTGTAHAEVAHHVQQAEELLHVFG
jgi:hypothetical protein